MTNNPHTPASGDELVERLLWIRNLAYAAQGDHWKYDEICENIEKQLNELIAQLRSSSTAPAPADIPADFLALLKQRDDMYVKLMPDGRLRASDHSVERYFVFPTPAREIDREKIARTICKSGKFDTGEGTCAVICMDRLGDVRKGGCGHCERVHGKLADSILSLLNNSTGGRDGR